MQGISTRVVLSTAVIVNAVGVLDAFIGRDWDLLVVFCLSLSLLLLVWIRARGNRTPVTLRPDLSRLVEHQSQRTGEPFDDVLDRAVAWYHRGLFVDDDPGPR